MTRALRQSTATTHRMGPFLDDDDGVTPMTGLTIAQADIQISKAGGAFAQTSEASPTTAYDKHGFYQVPLTATDTSTAGPLRVEITKNGALPVWEDFVVLAQAVYDALVAGTDNLDVDLVNAPNATAVAAIQSGLATPANILGANAPGAYTAGQVGYLIGTNLDATVSSRSTLAAGAQMDLVNAPNATAIAAIVTAVWAATTRSLTTFGTLAANTATAVWAASTRSLTTFGTLAADTAAAVWAATTRTLTAIGDTVIASFVAGMWNAIMSSYTVAGSFGARFATLARTGEVTATSPVSSDGATLSLVIGYAYTDANGNPLEWTNANDTWPDLTSATLTLRIYSTATPGDLFTVTGTAVNAGATSQSAKFSVTAAQTSLLAATKSVYVFYVEASVTLSGTTTKSCLVRGWVNPTITPAKNPYCGT